MSLHSSTNCDNFSIAPITVTGAKLCNYRPAAGTFKQDFQAAVGGDRGRISRIISITDCRFVISPIYDITRRASTSGQPLSSAIRTYVHPGPREFILFARGALSSSVSVFRSFDLALYVRFDRNDFGGNVDDNRRLPGGNRLVFEIYEIT